MVGLGYGLTAGLFVPRCQVHEQFYPVTSQILRALSRIEHLTHHDRDLRGSVG